MPVVQYLVLVTFFWGRILTSASNAHIRSQDPLGCNAGQRVRHPAKHRIALDLYCYYLWNCGDRIDNHDYRS
jgi:hypothetical protein